MKTGRAAIAGSAPVRPASTHQIGNVGADTSVTASIILQRQTPDSKIGERLFSPDFQPLSPDDAARQLGADPNELLAVEEFCQANALQILSADAATRSVKVQGSAAQMEAAFGIQLGMYQGENGQEFISYDGEITVPRNLATAILAITGLDNRPVARAHDA